MAILDTCSPYIEPMYPVSLNHRESLTLTLHYVQCSKWTGTYRNGVPVREVDRCNRSVSSRYARSHQNAVPVHHFSIIIPCSTMKLVGHGGALVEAITINRRVVGSTPVLAAM